MSSDSPQDSGGNVVQIGRPLLLAESAVLEYYDGAITVFGRASSDVYFCSILAWSQTLRIYGLTRCSGDMWVLAQNLVKQPPEDYDKQLDTLRSSQVPTLAFAAKYLEKDILQISSKKEFDGFPKPDDLFLETFQEFASRSKNLGITIS